MLFLITGRLHLIVPVCLPLAEPPQGTWKAGLGAIFSDKTQSGVPEEAGRQVRGIGGLGLFFVTAMERLGTPDKNKSNGRQHWPDLALDPRPPPPPLTCV